MACAAEDLSARRFAEYLSLGEHEGAPAPQSWERFLVEAAVIGGRARWERRLSGLAARLALARREAEDDARIAQDEQELARLRAFALPILDELAALTGRATWGVWLERLHALAARALRDPARVHAVLGELAPMSTVGPIELAEVRLVLGRRLAEIVRPAEASRAGMLLVAPVEAARGLAFDVVFVPGLAEKLFPQKVVEDPLLRDDARAALSPELQTTVDRAAAERLALRLAVGAARARLVVSYPRLDLEQGRPRVPSFYALELLRATTGRLPGWNELAAVAERTGAARIGWPAPASPDDAIDEAEHDLAILDRNLATPATGVARYLLGANPHLARALRVRARRWIPRWTRADGLYDPSPEARAVLDRHRLAARSFSATALQQFAACPYRFFLHTVHRLSPREIPERIEEMDPLSRGSLVHEVQFHLFSALRDEGVLPITAANLDRARERLDRVLDEIAGRFKDDLAPAIDRVWDDGVAAVRADLREWLRLHAEQSEWNPWRFELAFGLAGTAGHDPSGRDPSSLDEPVTLDCGIRLRGAIDLVERAADDSLRATDHKTGRVRAHRGSVIGGGEHLQPVLYALALEKLFPGARVVSGRLYYCTHVGGYAAIDVPLDGHARHAAGVVADVVGGALERGELPAAPAPGACTWCDYRPVCGPHEERRIAAKNPERLVQLQHLRRMP
jgi:CRISPR/Cas system-associated exonuclease Cas4 (RecB family)